MPSDKDRLCSLDHNGQTCFPVLDTTPGHDALIIFFEDADDLIEHYPDAMPYDELLALTASSEMFEAARHNHDVLIGRDLVTAKLPKAQGVAWYQLGNQILDLHSQSPVLTLTDNQYTEANGKLICNGRAGLHCVYIIYSILQRDKVFDPTKYPGVVDAMRLALVSSGHTNVTETL